MAPSSKSHKRSAPDNDEIDMEDVDVVNVDFDFFDFVDDDFLSIKNLLRQLISLDSTKFNLSDLTQIVLDSKSGSAIKADDEEYNDVLAMLALVKYDPTKPVLKELGDYWIERSAENIDVQKSLRKAFKGNSAILLSERMLNMPLEIVYPLYKLLYDELAQSQHTYDYIVIPSRLYSEKEPKAHAREHRAAKKGTGTRQEELLPFHPEDNIIGDIASAKGSFTFITPIEETDSRRAFQDYGIYPYGSITVLPFSKLSKLTEALEKLPEIAL